MTAEALFVAAFLGIVSGAGSRPPARATIKGYTYRGSIALLGGVYRRSVSAEVHERAGVAAGDVVAVDVELDTAPPEVAVSDDLGRALKKTPPPGASSRASRCSNQRRLVTIIDAAKTGMTRQSRIAQTVEKLRAGKA